MGSLSDGNDRANPSQESTPRDRSTGGYAVETVISQRPRVRTTDRKYSNTEARGKDSARGSNNTIAYPPHTLQPTGRQNFFHEPVLSEVTQQGEMNAHRLAWPGVTHGDEITTEIRGAQRSQLSMTDQYFGTSRTGQCSFRPTQNGFILVLTTPHWSGTCDSR